MNINIGLIDYGMGNLYSVQQSLRRLKQTTKLIKSPKDLTNCKALILPGVGSFDPAMENLRKTNLIPEIKTWVQSKKPLLGICLGLQLMFESSDEGNLSGLGLLKGHVSSLPKNQPERIPHMGWSPLKQKKQCPLLEEQSNSKWMYFVHSYSAIPLAEDLAATVSFGGEDITAIVWRDNIGACQFHPEKSGIAGKSLLDSWLKWVNEKG
ncbi:MULTISPECIES: imidazole glycerol phosphate synthase subunit HisH [Prochlorococcus]|uniref:imidazole glycerol phosphate synthase subunit HisH n=1 Tax=Prochlorococcus TaxID=1218 RepID=UPI0005339FE4|nr:MULTISPECIES: imidazole glycerol phosphate synthase subunit HisH [Prochlorococcus]KGG12218.1 Imidazole glycerol phosphate synthase amidotransferase subunit [Prochlorococcus sp. MIT 0601]